jgi:hypothetical protein
MLVAFVLSRVWFVGSFVAAEASVDVVEVAFTTIKGTPIRLGWKVYRLKMPL